MNAEPISRRPGSRARTVAAALLVIAVAYLAHRVHALERATTTDLGDLRAAAERLERTVQLLRLEASTGASGVHAVVEQIARFAPELASAITAAPAAREIRARLEHAVTAAEELGPKAFDGLEAAFAEEEDPEARRWLLRACTHADPERGRELAAQVLRGTRHRPDAVTRLRAADALLELDREYAGEVLASVLRYESAMGLKTTLPAELAKQYESYVRGSKMPSYFNLIGRFVASGHPDTESVLLEILSRDEHDRNTYQACAKELAKLRSKAAVRRLERLFERPPFGFVDPLFQNICLQALADIQGADARPFFERALGQPQQEIVETKLQALLKQLDG